MKEVTLTRVVTFSSGHRYWLQGVPEAENRLLFGAWASPHNHGHNYELSVSVTGEVSESDGMVVNIKEIDAALRDRIVAQLDQKSINDEVRNFQSRPPCLENLLDWAESQLDGMTDKAILTHIRLKESATLWADKNPTMNTTTVTRTYEFAASHRLHVPSATDEENFDLFGKCNNPAGHGHNYLLEVTVTGERDPKTGFIVDIQSLDDAVNSRVIERYDHKNLNCDVPELEGKNPTSEVVAVAIFDLLQKSVPASLVSVRLHETARNIFEVRA